MGLVSGMIGDNHFVRMTGNECSRWMGSITGHYSLEIFCYNPGTDCFTACLIASIPSCLILPAFPGNATFVLNFSGVA